MRRTLTCASCGGGRIWQIARMQEQHEDGALAPMVAEGGGELSLAVCAGCGYTAWYGGEARGPVAIGHACAECGSLDLAQAGELREEHGWTPFHITVGAGRLLVAVCRECQRLRFTADDIPTHALAGERGACRWCGGERLESLIAVHERGVFGVERRLPVAFHSWLLGDERRGTFNLRICRSCGDTEWHGDHLAELRDDPRAGVKLVERPVAAQGGPYR